MTKKYRINIINGEEPIIYLPHEFAKNEFTKIAFGTLSLEAKFSPAKIDGENTLTISHGLAKALKIPMDSGPLHVFVQEKILYIGPLVGIFTSGFTPYEIRPIGERSAFFSKLLSVDKPIGALVFVFGEQHINWEQGTIQGLFHMQDEWKKLEVPFPNVIYDRLPNRRSEQNPHVKKVKEKLQAQYLIPWYNPGFFNKLDIYERLVSDKNVAHYLPETFPFTSLSMIERMLSDYGHVFIKPIHGSLGLGVHQIVFDKEEGHYYIRYRNKEHQNKLLKFRSLESLFNYVFQKQNLSNFLVQQGINLIRIENRLLDFRVHTNKDDQGNWQVTAIAAKLAGVGSVTTHINNGGTIKLIDEIFPQIDEKEEIIQKFSEAALQLSKSLEQQIEGIIGEIGFDLGIDNTGKIWLFEANSKPGRSIFKHPHLKKFEYLTRKLSLAFAVFLTKKAIEQPEEILK
ncbi:YheC/YheD family protein [Cytobacillus sp. Hz8]|uniref:YheC/YheD family endospore coat-associated protein n=1 Tax=Cytobacillus sp. Hz8 TaxID=3347168 RepID=UPI0035DBF256